MRWLAAAAGCAGLLVAAPPATAAGSYRFLAGAAVIQTTPPRASDTAANARYAPELARCPAGSFPNRGGFALQEPFHGSVSDFCDANLNGRWDGLFADNGRGPVTGVHDPIDVRALAISDGVDVPVVYASVDQIGLFDYYTERARYYLLHTYGVHADLVVSADHNESSPDSIGLYGAVQTPIGVGLRSGIDEYYMRFLEDRIAYAAATAVSSMRRASLYANQVSGRVPDRTAGNRYPLLRGLSERISDQFPTTVALPHDDRVAAIDPKLGVLQARDGLGRPIFTVISLAAHNQEMGNSGTGLSADWPGAMERAVDRVTPGVAMFLAGENGSQEDPQTQPAVIARGSENHSSQTVQWIQASATGRRFASIAVAAAAGAVRLARGRVALVREAFCVPLENNGFVALAAVGEFGLRQGYTCSGDGRPLAPVPNGFVTPTVSTQFRTFVSYADIGPDLQLLDNPGEAFPALMLGSPFGAAQESCNRPNPAVPTWHARALFRFQVGLADDLIGYLIPAWGFASGTPGLFSGDTCYQDMHGHGHKLESESVGPRGANDVANRLAALLDREPDPSAHIVRGRYVQASGALSRWPTAAAGMTISGGPLIGAGAVVRFGARVVNLRGVFMDFDGQPQARPDITTRGMMVLDRRGCVASRYYLNVFPELRPAAPLGAALSARRPRRGRRCPVLRIGAVAELQPGAARAAGLG